MSFAVRIVTLLLALATACRTPIVSDPKLGPDIRDALTSGSEVNVMVALTTDPATNGQDPTAATAAIAKAQDAVLSTLDSTDFRLRQRYTTVPALSGTLRSTRGLDRLLTHRLVRRVDRDVGGAGSRDQ